MLSKICQNTKLSNFKLRWCQVKSPGSGTFCTGISSWWVHYMQSRGMRCFYSFIAFRVNSTLSDRNQDDSRTLGKKKKNHLLENGMVVLLPVWRESCDEGLVIFICRLSLLLSFVCNHWFRLSFPIPSASLRPASGYLFVVLVGWGSDAWGPAIFYVRSVGWFLDGGLKLILKGSLRSRGECSKGGTCLRNQVALPQLCA